MLNAVASRVREIATLRAMGFGGGSVVFSVLIESILLGAAGGLLGGVFAMIFLNGMQSSTMNFQTFSQITYAFTVTPQLMIAGIVYGLLLSLHRGNPSRHSRGAQPITTGPARIVRRGDRFKWLGALALAGASSFQWRRRRPIGPMSKAASSTRITPTTRARSTACSLRSGPRRSRARPGARRTTRARVITFVALTNYRIAQVLAATNKSRAKDAIDDCGEEIDASVHSLPKVSIGLDESPVARRQRAEDYALGHRLHARRSRDEFTAAARGPHWLAHR